MQLGLKRAMADRTVIVIAHRLATVQEADKIVVLEQGRIITAMLLSAWLVYAIEGRFLAAACCSAMAALLAWFGVIHAWQFSPGDTVMHLGWGTGRAWAEGYAAITVIVLLARWRQQTDH